MLGAVLAVTNGRRCRDSCTCVRRGVFSLWVLTSLGLKWRVIWGGRCVFRGPRLVPAAGAIYFLFFLTVCRARLVPAVLAAAGEFTCFFFFLPGCVLVCWFVACWTLTAHAANGCLPSVTESCPIVFKAQWRDEACAGEGECACLHLCAG